MKKILHFDDDLLICNLYNSIFRENGFDYKSYSEPPKNEKDFVNLVLSENPDAIISDITHPNLDGFEMLRILQREGETINIPFIFLTNHNEPEEIKRARAMGAFAYFVMSETKLNDLVSFLKSELENRDNHPKITGSKRGVFVLLAKTSSGEDEFLTFGFDIFGFGKAMEEQAKKLGKKFEKTYDLPIFNDVLFANWFLDEIQKDKIIPSNGVYFIHQIISQERWDFVRDKVIAQEATTALLNPCIAKDHKCPAYRFFLDEEKDFNKMQEWLAKCPNEHYTLNGYEKSRLMLPKKPSFDEKGEFKFLEEEK